MVDKRYDVSLPIDLMAEVGWKEAEVPTRVGKPWLWNF